MYYDYLKKGYSKSLSLKQARIDFLNSSDQLMSHPYFWGALTIYGINDALFLNKALIIISIAVVLLVIIAIIVLVFKKKRPKLLFHDRKLDF